MAREDRDGSPPTPKFWAARKLLENFLQKLSSKNAKFGAKSSHLCKNFSRKVKFQTPIFSALENTVYAAVFVILLEICSVWSKIATFCPPIFSPKKLLTKSGSLEDATPTVKYRRDGPVMDLKDGVICDVTDRMLTKTTTYEAL